MLGLSTSSRLTRQQGFEMAHKTELDAVDRKIVRQLATDGRASYQAIADEVGLSRPAVMERVKRLEEAGYITGYGARLDRAKAGFPVAASDLESLQHVLRDLRGSTKTQLTTRTTIVLGTVFEKPGFVPGEPD